MSNNVATQYQACPPCHITFGDVLSRRTAYGLIWLGKYRNHNCVVKMIMLSTGVHYDKNIKQYQNPVGQVIKEEYANKYFGKNDEKPFYHVDFRHRRSMTPVEFFKELDDLIYLSKLGIAPKVYGYGVNRSHDIHYGFIVMEKVDCSLKDIYLRRELTSTEDKLVHELIDQLHYKQGIVHGDLKPSNLGVYLDQSGHITNACFFDCQKNKHRDKFKPEEYKKLVDRENNTFDKHILLNRQSSKK